MGVKSFASLKEELVFELGNRPDVTTPTDYAGKWVNAAYMILCTQNRMWGLRKNWYFPELEASETKTTTDGVAYISVPTDCLIVRHIWDSTNDVLLTNISWYNYLRSVGRANTSSEGKPTQWVRRGNYLYLYTTPDATYSEVVHYRKRPALLTGVAVTVIGAEWDDIIIKLAKIRALMALGEYTKAEVEKKEFIEMVTNVIGIYDQEEKARRDYMYVDPFYKKYEY